MEFVFYAYRIGETKIVMSTLVSLYRVFSEWQRNGTDSLTTKFEFLLPSIIMDELA